MLILPKCLVNIWVTDFSGSCFNLSVNEKSILSLEFEIFQRQTFLTYLKTQLIRYKCLHKNISFTHVYTVVSFSIKFSFKSKNTNPEKIGHFFQSIFQTLELRSSLTYYSSQLDPHEVFIKVASTSSLLQFCKLLGNYIVLIMLKMVDMICW